MLPETPAFWKEDGFLPALLSPLSWLYFLGHRLKTALSNPYTAAIPVLCVGGVVAGGSGKTPTVHALLDLIRSQDLFVNPVILTRGYGGALKGPSLVDPNLHGWQDVGDEALLHALQAPTIVSKSRAAGARLAEAMGADIILLDDGLQNNSLQKTLSFLVMDAQQGIGNGRLLPAGPLREPLKDAMAKCAAIIETAGKSDKVFPLPVFLTRLELISEHDTQSEYLAFAGLGRPEKFKETLLRNGFKISDFIGFPDHHHHTETTMNKLIEQAGTRKIITTQKDYMRVPPAFKNRVEVLSIKLSFYDPQAIGTLIQGLCRV